MHPEIVNWGMDWAWGLPLILLTVIIHAFALGLISQKVTATLSGVQQLRESSAISIFVMGAAALSATLLHAFEVFIWASAYRLVGALQDGRSAMLYSLNAMTSYGHEGILLEPRWQMMGAIESLDGWILFGLTTASLFTVMQKMRPHSSAGV
jgi:hypothetical protein